MAEITKQDVADYVNARMVDGTLTYYEVALIDSKLDPEFAEILIKLLGDVTTLVQCRDNKSNE